MYLHIIPLFYLYIIPLFYLFLRCSSQTASSSTTQSPTVSSSNVSAVPGCTTQYILLQRYSAYASWLQVMAFDAFGNNVLLNAPSIITSGTTDIPGYGNSGITACLDGNRQYIGTSNGLNAVLYDIGAPVRITSVRIYARDGYAFEINNAQVVFLSLDQVSQAVVVPDAGSFSNCQVKDFPTTCAPWPTPSASRSPSATSSFTPSPSPCTAGFVCSSGAAVLCPAGSYCPIGSVQSPCPAGRFSASGATSCAPCVAGKYAPRAGATSCEGADVVMLETLAFWGCGLSNFGQLTALNDTVYVGDGCNSRIALISGASSSGTVVSTAFESVVSLGVAVSPSGYIFTSTNTHQLFAAFPGAIAAAVAGDGVPRWLDSTIATSASFNFPRGLAIDPKGRVLVADSNNFRVRLVVPGGPVTTLAGNSVRGNVDGVGSIACFQFPAAITLDASGYIAYVADGSAVRTLTLVGSTGLVTTLVLASSLNQFTGVAVDLAVNHVFAIDSRNSQIVRVFPNATSVFAGNGIASTLATDGPAGLGTFFFVKYLSDSNIGMLAVSSSGTFYVNDPSSARIRTIRRSPCPAGFTCDAPFTRLTPCPPGFFCPSGSFAPTPCPPNTASLLVSAGSLAACYLNGTVVAAPTTFAAPTPPPSFAAAPGAPCSSNATCSSGACLSGSCCSPAAASLGCLACQPGTGSCATFSPGEPCASPFDCATNLCQGGCCCAASAVQTLGCAACACLANASTPPSLAGACTSAVPASAALPAPATLPCNGTVSINASVPLSRVIAFPPSANVSGAAPLVLLPPTSPLNAYGVDIVLASASACAAFAANGAAAKCSAVAYSLPGGAYYYLGAAAALGMAPAPGCAA